MNALELAIWSLLILSAFVFYKIVTARLALNAREAMVPVVRSVLEDKNVPHEIKLFALGAFHLSCSSGFLPELLWYSISPFRKAKKNEDEIAFEKACTEHAKLTDALVRHHLLRINALAAPHWYCVLFFLIVLAATIIAVLTLGMKTGQRIFNSLEQALFNPESFVLRYSETVTKSN